MASGGIPTGSTKLGTRRIYSVRPRAHEFFLEWFCEREREGAAIHRILEVGCGRAVPYARIFRAYDYYGTDISEKEIAICREQYGADDRHFFAGDAIAGEVRGPYDLVYSHAVIDHVYDVNAFLEKLAAATCGWLYVSAYAGWHPRLDRHAYRWHEDITCYQDEISPKEARSALAAIGCGEIQVFPVYVGNNTDDVPFETVITARRK